MDKLIYLARRAATVSREDWPETWRSHARFAATLSGGGTGSAINASRYCNRVDAPALGGELVALLGLDATYDGVAVMWLQDIAALRQGVFSAEQRALIQKDELRVFDRPTPETSFTCRESLVIDGPIGKAAVIRFLTRAQDLSPEAFAARLGNHADVVRRLGSGGLLSYAHNTLIAPPPEGFRFDAITEAWYASVEEATRSLLDPEMAPLTADLSTFTATTANVTMLTSAVMVWGQRPG
jgi:hypothetical protein